MDLLVYRHKKAAWKKEFHAAFLAISLRRDSLFTHTLRQAQGTSPSIDSGHRFLSLSKGAGYLL